MALSLVYALISFINTSSSSNFTDMEFKLPLESYKDYNLVVHGWWHLVKQQSWTSLNAGVFLIRNCQWSLDFIDEWASMGPQGDAQEKWGEIQRDLLKDKLYPGSDDQSALIYLLLKESKKWGDKVHLENEYNFQSYWLGVVGGLDDISKGYNEVEREVVKLRRRHGEKVSEEYMKERKMWKENVRRPFVTHFTGCEPCSGDFEF